MERIMKSKITCIVTTVLMIIFFSGGLYMHQQKYKMVVFVTPDSENDSEWPNKRKWFDASEWLKTKQYIKIDDFYLINSNYIPIDDLNVFGITHRIQSAINSSGGLDHKLYLLKDMSAIDFLNLMRGQLSYEYLRTEFNDKTLKPTDDYFLISFSYKGKIYEVELLREIYKSGFIFMTYGSVVNKSGYWHSVSPAGYSYKDYREGRPLTK